MLLAQCFTRHRNDRSAMHLAAAMVIFTLAFSGCRSTQPDDLPRFKVTSLDNLIRQPGKYRNAKVAFDAYVLGTELQRHSGDHMVWIMVLGDVPQPNDKLASQLIFPDIHHKLRVLEDGYNKHTLNRCEAVCQQARKSESKIRVFGTYQPSEGFKHYNSGIHMQLSAIEVNGTRINTDFNDQSKLQAEAPGLFKRMYQGGTKLMKAVGKAL